MKTLKLLSKALLVLALCFSITSCSEEEPGGESGNSKPVNPQNVFTGGLPKTSGDATMSYNADGLLTKIITNDNNIEVNFEYLNAARAASENNQVRMTVVEKEYNEKYVFDMQINKNGFVQYCTETYSDQYGTENGTWEFEYNTDGQLCYMKRSEGGNEVTQITYNGGNITETSIRSETEPEAFIHKITYTSDKITTPIENKGCVMMFDLTLGVDLDEMEYAYYAGLLGKATKHLPIQNNYKDGEEDVLETYNWTLNNAGLPTDLKIVYSWGSTDNFSFSWQ